MTAGTQARQPTSVARITRAVARITAPLSRPLAGRRLFPLWAVVHHRGRRSGNHYAVPVAVRVTAERFVIALPWGDQTQWLRNVVVADGCMIRWRGEDFRASRPEVVGLAEAAEAFSPMQRWLLRMAGVDRFLRLTRRSALR